MRPTISISHDCAKHAIMSTIELTRNQSESTRAVLLIRGQIAEIVHWHGHTVVSHRITPTKPVISAKDKTRMFALSAPDLRLLSGVVTKLDVYVTSPTVAVISGRTKNVGEVAAPIAYPMQDQVDRFFPAIPLLKSAATSGDATGESWLSRGDIQGDTTFMSAVQETLGHAPYVNVRGVPEHAVKGFMLPSVIVAEGWALPKNREGAKIYTQVITPTLSQPRTTVRSHPATLLTTDIMTAKKVA